MKTHTPLPTPSFESLPTDYASLCRQIWLPRPIHDDVEHSAALAAIEPLWGHEEAMNGDQTDWFKLVADLIAQYEDGQEPQQKPLPLNRRNAGMLEAHSLSAADLSRRLDLESSMGSTILKGTR